MRPAEGETPASGSIAGDSGMPPVRGRMPDGKMTMDGFARWVLSAVDPNPDRVPYLRHQAGLVLHLWRLDETAWTTELLLTELASNVVRHARTLFSVGMTWDGRTLRGEVTDANPAPPRPEDHQPGRDESSGRGLVLVGQIATRWGCEQRYHGKTVWFEIPATA